MFQVGDIVRLKTGSSAQKVLEVDDKVIRAQYLSRLHDCDRPRWRDASDYVLKYDKECKPMETLYQTTSLPTRFGVKIATNSRGKYVLEMKDGRGGVEVFEPHLLEKVVPFTVDLEPLVKHNNRQGNIHLVAKPDQVEKDDILLELNTGEIWRVVQLDTKNRSPRENKSKWLKIPTTTITFGLQNEDF